jgi:glutathione S-transferase
MQREILPTLGVHYCHIPVMAIARDIWWDSRVIIQKLEDLYPDSCLGASAPFEQAVEYLLGN